MLALPTGPPRVSILLTLTQSSTSFKSMVRQLSSLPLKALNSPAAQKCGRLIPQSLSRKRMAFCVSSSREPPPRLPRSVLARLPMSVSNSSKTQTKHMLVRLKEKPAGLPDPSKRKKKRRKTTRRTLMTKTPRRRKKRKPSLRAGLLRFLTPAISKKTSPFSANLHAKLLMESKTAMKSTITSHLVALRLRVRP